ncbi:hypothetical protein BU26DRAFT_501256 [Trematosphaeria pertusa]|uniref:Yeast cell wall synthesis Kre9/Knh1-like N-terminal domain-containing protein n=1 Tax=Trematosphaeria pertusa TaxID=390896 RepID=A0A6A6IS92_9PLEO|nr:uncharacterized protein BU26DRAFT_501256 [Trematosphaeria pertusa]KAF2252987.1 hypothetical protein BU26DRAFT_501256 [Trematosphaeria pertusa]
MRFFDVVLSGAALISAAMAVQFTSFPTSIEPGKTYTLEWTPADDTPTTIKLRQGDPNDLDTIATLTDSATGGSYEWTVDASLPNANDYALEIDQEGADPNYSDLITLTGSSAEPSSSGSASPSATASETASSTEISTTVETTTTLITTATSASASVSSTIGSNSTIASATLSSTGSGSTSEPTSSGGSPPQETNAAGMLGSSPLALIFGAVAAMAYLN